MKKLSILFVSALTLGTVFTSCNKDDDNNSPSLEGKWVNSKEGTITASGVESLHDYENECTTKMNYMDVKTGGTLNEVYYTSTCTEDITPGQWQRNGNTVTVDYGEGDVMTGEIITLDATTLKVKMPTSDPAMFDVMVFNRG